LLLALGARGGGHSMLPRQRSTPQRHRDGVDVGGSSASLDLVS